MPRLFSAFSKNKEEMVSLKLGDAAPPPAAKPYVPNHKFVIGTEADPQISIQVTEHHGEDRMTAEVATSLRFIKGTNTVPLRPGALRLFASDIERVQRTQSGFARLTVIPNSLAFSVLFDDKHQLIFAVDYRRIGGFGVGTIVTLPLSPADLPAIVDSLQAADPGQLTPDRLQHLREQIARDDSVQPGEEPGVPPAPAVPPDRVVLTVGEEEITAAEFDRMMEAVPLPLRRRKRGEFARNFIHRRVLVQAARRRKLDETPAFKEQLARSAEQILTTAFWSDINAAAQVDEAACRAYFEEHKREFDRVKYRQILIRIPGSPVPARVGETVLSDQQALAKAQDIRQRLLDGADFAALAKAESDDFLAGSRAGEVGWRDHGPADSPFSNPVLKAAFALPLGEISEPVRDDKGYHLIVVDERREKTYAEAQREVRSRLNAELRRRTEEQLQMSTPVVLDADYFALPYPPADFAGTAGVVTSQATIESVPGGALKTPGSPNRLNQQGSLQAIQLIRGSMPVYPQEAKAAGIAGHVTLYVAIAQDGTLLEAQPATGHALLIPAAMEAVRDWIWRPTLQNGLPVEVTTRVDFEFRLPK